MSKSEVIKHSSTIQVTNTISLLQRRAWNVLLANAYDELPDKDEYVIDLADLQEELSFNSKNKDYLRDTLKGLMKCIIEWNILEKDEEEWAAMPIVGQVKIKGSKLYYSYAPELRRKLYNPRMYARISLSMQNKFSSKYSLALYELFIDYYDVSRSYGETPWIEIDKYRSLMGIGENEYTEFRELKRRTIKSPIDEINEKSDISVEDVYKNTGRKVIAIKFKIRRKPEALLLSAKATAASSAAGEDDLFTNGHIAQLEAFGLSHSKAEELTNKYEQQIIEHWIECLNGNHIKNVTNKPGYLVAALEKGFDFPPTYANRINQKKTVDKQREREGRRKSCSVCKGEGGWMEEAVIDGRNYSYWKDCECVK